MTEGMTREEVIQVLERHQDVIAKETQQYRELENKPPNFVDIVNSLEDAYDALEHAINALYEIMD